MVERLDDDWVRAEGEQDGAEDAALRDAGGGRDGLSLAVFQEVGELGGAGVCCEKYAEHGASLVLL